MLQVPLARNQSPATSSLDPPKGHGNYANEDGFPMPAAPTLRFDIVCVCQNPAARRDWRRSGASQGRNQCCNDERNYENPIDFRLPYQNQ